MTLITVIVPVYNGENYLSETLDSIFTNTNTNTFECEVVVVDDGSTDSTANICLKYGERINYLRQDNQGEFFAINKGLYLAKGNYILVVSHDDPMLSPSLIPKAISILENCPELVCAYPDWQIIDSFGLIIETRIVKEYSEIELLGKFNCLPGPGAVFRKKDALEIGGRRNWKYVSDYDFWLRLSRRGEFIRIPGILAQWRSHNDSTTVSMKNLDMAQERIDVIENFLKENMIDKKISQMSLGSAYYFAARLGVFSSRIPAKKWIAISFLKRRGWPEVANPLVVLFILALPLSKFLIKRLMPFSTKLKSVF